ncbi:hypothetical protein ScPMuIL_006694 [Solemya velum]
MESYNRERQSTDRVLSYAEKKSRFSANIPLERKKRKQAPVAPLRPYSFTSGQDEAGDAGDKHSRSFLRKVLSENLEKTNVNQSMKSISHPDSDSVSTISDSSSCSSVPVSPSHNRKAASAPNTLPKTFVSKQHYLPVSLTNNDDIISFSHLRDQVHRRTTKQVFEFTIMVVGESGLGKSTLLNTLFLAELYKDRQVHRVQENLSQTTDIEVRQINMTERGVKLRLTIVDTPGFGDPVNGEECWKSIVEYVDHQMDQYFHAESGLNRKRIQDMRVHCCLYFISPYGHGLKPMDIDLMKRLHNKVNIIPIIAKADILTSTELKNFKQRILYELAENKIHIYSFPQSDSDDEDEFHDEDQDLRSAVPFAVVGCDSIVQTDGKTIRSRTYPWGIVEVDNPEHCDFLKLKKTISIHMQDLRNITSEVLYENYRAELLSNEDSLISLSANRSTEVEMMLQQKEEEIRRMQAILTNIQTQMTDENAPHVPPRPDYD